MKRGEEGRGVVKRRSPARAPREDERCEGRSRHKRKEGLEGDEARCGNWKITGTRFCRFHGGRQQAKANARREVQARARAMLGIPKEVAPWQALSEQLWEANGNVEAARQALLALQGGASVDELEWFSKLVGKTGLSEGEVRAALVRFYDSERDRVVRIAKIALDAGVDEARLQIEAQMATLIFEIVRSTLADPGLKLSAAQQLDAARQVGGRLRLLAAGETGS